MDYKKEYEMLDACLEKQKGKIEELKAENVKLNAIIDGYQPRLQRYKDILQEIKEIAEKELSYDMVGNEHRHYRNYDIIRHLITESEA